MFDLWIGTVSGLETSRSLGRCSRSKNATRQDANSTTRSCWTSPDTNPGWNSRTRISRRRWSRPEPLAIWSAKAPHSSVKLTWWHPRRLRCSFSVKREQARNWSPTKPAAGAGSRELEDQRNRRRGGTLGGETNHTAFKNGQVGPQETRTLRFSILNEDETTAGMAPSPQQEVIVLGGLHQLRRLSRVPDFLAINGLNNVPGPDTCLRGR